jgi:hypothetical protein
LQSDFAEKGAPAILLRDEKCPVFLKKQARAQNFFGRKNNFISD